ncbi:sugar phosphate isomerase/epimerase and 4-hydroxyphenylpyruvate domain-containing protein [Actinospica durhamensis]|uniref:3-dehydroshikimate dehydratase n=1 Tax=Actinospica durhamensis TaxID=1508375 RepID=A0A941EP23_9ACTN|nr:sugar phosphate isomerase/epimerase and 4-hydroxyphenylpyruvate domain-containing protein [Actinospica durhamensis]MBR7834640.1 sugar phosphate isomerase/epimerase and 4-hydroxyphenylpyruvate domain-containing protein [Actinospica durhamensis]
MRTCIATVSLSGSLTEKLAACAAAGFDGIEIFEPDLVASPLSPEQIAERARELGLSIDLYQPLREFEAVDEDEFTRNLRRARRKFEVMRRLGTDLLLVCSNVSPRTVDDDALAAAQLGLLADAAAEHGIRIAYEALAWGTAVNTYAHSWRIVEAADRPNLGLCLDSFHILARDGDPRGIEQIPGDKIFFLQLADAPRTTMDILQWSRHLRCFPGQGGFDVAGVTGAALKAGYHGPLSLEVFNDEFRQADSARTAVDGRRSLIRLQEQLGILDLPAAPAPSGIAYAQISAADPERVRRQLTALGFTTDGWSRQGDLVETWQQGDARILITTGSAGRDSHRDSHHDVARLTAIGLHTPDPAAAAKRAEHLLAPVLPRDHRPQEAVIAPDGSLLYLVPAPPEGASDGGPNAPTTVVIDHVALTQQWHGFDEAALFYSSVLGLTLRESVELADPRGLFRSRTVTNADESVRLALNLAPHPAHIDQHAQHVAFAVPSVIDAVRRLRAAGHDTLAIPANYYDDLDARFDLPAQTLVRLRELGILYDRDEHGEFLHCYTESVGRVFFELLQRVGGYRGYGAANAPVRMAAQHNHTITAGR